MWAIIDGNEFQRADACHHSRAARPFYTQSVEYTRSSPRRHINDDDVIYRRFYSSSWILSLQLYILALSRLLGLSKANGVVAKIVNAIPSAQEGVAEDGQRTYGLWEVHSHEAADTRALNL